MLQITIRIPCVNTSVTKETSYCNCEHTSSIPQPEVDSSPIDDDISTEIVENSRHVILFPSIEKIEFVRGV